MSDVIRHAEGRIRQLHVYLDANRGARLASLFDHRALAAEGQAAFAWRGCELNRQPPGAQPESCIDMLS